MDNDKETEKTEETKLRDLTPEKDAKGGASPEVFDARPNTGTVPQPNPATDPAPSAPNPQLSQFKKV